MSHTLEEYKQAALDAGAEKAWADWFEGGKEIGVAFRKNGITHAVRFKLDRPFCNVFDEVKGFVRNWKPRNSSH